MRVSETLLKTVGYVAEVVHSGKEDHYDHSATGFFVTVTAPAEPSRGWGHFVTARHVAVDLQDRDIAFLVNTRSGGVAALTMSSDRWFFHPDASVDVAVLPFSAMPEHDLVTIGPESFLTPDLMTALKIGLGDELIIPGLFTFAPGVKRNLPIVRIGSLAMIPDEPIQVDCGFAQVYLVEARSIGGLSGSPVFVRGSLKFPLRPMNADGEFMGTSSIPYLLGLMHGHWDIRESEMNKAHFVADRQRGVNLGIGVVVPAEKILEVLDHPGLIAMRQNVKATPNRKMPNEG